MQHIMNEAGLRITHMLWIKWVICWWVYQIFWEFGQLIFIFYLPLVFGMSRVICMFHGAAHFFEIWVWARFALHIFTLLTNVSPFSGKNNTKLVDRFFRLMVNKTLVYSVRLSWYFPFIEIITTSFLFRLAFSFPLSLCHFVFQSAFSFLLLLCNSFPVPC